MIDCNWVDITLSFLEISARSGSSANFWAIQKNRNSVWKRGWEKLQQKMKNELRTLNLRHSRTRASPSMPSHRVCGKFFQPRYKRNQAQHILNFTHNLIICKFILPYRAMLWTNYFTFLPVWDSLASARKFRLELIHQHSCFVVRPGHSLKHTNKHTGRNAGSTCCQSD